MTETPKPPEDALADLLAGPMPEDGTLVRAKVDDSWRGKLVLNGRSQMVPDSLANLIVILSHYDKYKGVFIHDKFSDEIIVARCPPWEEDADFIVHRLEDDDIVQCAAALEYVGLKPSISSTKNAIERAAKKYPVHPVRDYFNALEWDGDKRLHTWLLDYARATDQPQEYVCEVGVKWMVAAVKRIYQPGAKFDHMLVLEGPQNIGKSRLLRTIATFGPLNQSQGEEREYFTDAIRFETINDLASIMALQGKLIVEFSELAGMSRKEIEEVKNWITVEKDEVQKKYKNEITRYPRQFVLAGSTNEDTWLRDATGNRRFLPVKCMGKINIEGLRAVREQLWAEAVWLYKDGYQTYIDHGSELEQLAATEQANRLIEDVWTNSVLENVQNHYDVTVNEVLQLMPVDPARRDEMAARRVSRILKMAGWVRRQKWVKGRNTKVWENPAMKKQTPENYNMPLETEEV